MSLILKRKHWRYTVLSILLALPAAATLVVAVLAWVTNLTWTQKVIQFTINRSPEVLAVVWIVLPLISWYLSNQAYFRGTIDRWRPINIFTQRVTVVCLLALIIGAIVGGV